MLKFIAYRLLGAVPVVALVSVAVFLFLRLSGDPVAAMLGENATAEQVAEIRHAMGLDRPILVQFVAWLGHLLRGDFGVSLVTRESVWTMVHDRLETTLSLALTTIVASVVIAVPLGLLAARYRGGWIDRGITLLCTVGFSVPTFVVGYLFVWLFSVKLGWLPAQGYARLGDGIGRWLLHLIGPTVAMSSVFIVLIARITRASAIETLRQDFIRTARALGAGELRVSALFVLRNAATPIVTIIGVGIGVVLTGVVVTETVFNLPGLGRLTIEAVLARDFPVIQCVIVLFSFTYVFINLMVDIVYALLDPRIRY
ncbi:ABC transporter permease [Rhodopseudomonas palustris]|uniref:ABC transporter permease n=1 Tax=Rhodopseudomonas palustris TaxID=1076 RepID=A0A418V116_RHOPL|nr:ABC transporter permease [Rhodopseudomonas palustris]RJF69511.1 ABC transporter permease [Rhodopseudomonas palustris]